MAEYQESYSSLLGTSQEEDATEFLSCLMDVQFHTQIVVVSDHYSLDHVWQRLVRTSLSVRNHIRMVAIDDRNTTLHDVDILIDPNYSTLKDCERYNSSASSCVKLLGPKYALFPPEYKHLKKLKNYNSKLKQINIYFGGTDPYHLTLKALTALTDVKYSGVTVI